MFLILNCAEKAFLFDSWSVNFLTCQGYPKPLIVRFIGQHLCPNVSTKLNFGVFSMFDNFLVSFVL